MISSSQKNSMPTHSKEPGISEKIDSIEIDQLSDRRDGQNLCLDHGSDCRLLVNVLFWLGHKFTLGLNWLWAIVKETCRT